MGDVAFDPPDDLAGEVRVDSSTQHAAFVLPGLEAVRITQDFGGARKYAAIIPVTRELMADATAMRSLVDQSIDRYLRPWKYADRITWPTFVPLPRLAAATDTYKRLRRRLSDAWYSLRYGRDDETEDDDW